VLALRPHPGRLSLALRRLLLCHVVSSGKLAIRRDGGAPSYVRVVELSTDW